MRPPQLCQDQAACICSPASWQRTTRAKRRASANCTARRCGTGLRRGSCNRVAAVDPVPRLPSRPSCERIVNDLSAHADLVSNMNEALPVSERAQRARALLRRLRRLKFGTRNAAARGDWNHSAMPLRVLLTAVRLRVTLVWRARFDMHPPSQASGAPSPAWPQLRHKTGSSRPQPRPRSPTRSLAPAAPVSRRARRRALGPSPRAAAARRPAATPPPCPPRTRTRPRTARRSQTPRT